MKATRCPICERVFAVDETLNPIVPEGEIVRGRDELGIKAEGVASPRDSTLLQIRTLVQRRARPKKSPLREAMASRLFNKQQTKPVHFFPISLEHVNWISHLAGRAVNIHGKSFQARPSNVRLLAFSLVPWARTAQSAG